MNKKRKESGSRETDPKMGCQMGKDSKRFLGCTLELDVVT